MATVAGKSRNPIVAEAYRLLRKGEKAATPPAGATAEPPARTRAAAKKAAAKKKARK